MDFDTIYNMILTAGMGAIAFFLKRSFDKLDSRASRSEVDELKGKMESADERNASKAELNELKGKIESADEKYASKTELNELKKSIEKIENNIDFLKENTVRNAEFVRLMSRLETKIDNLNRE